MFRHFRLVLATVVLVCAALTTACAGETVPGEVADDNPTTPPPEGFPLELVVSVDWEGGVLTEPNTRAIEAFRARFPEVRLTHFLNAAYYARPEADAVAITATARRAIRADDELGLHIHAWDSLVRASGAPLAYEPTYEGPLGRAPGTCPGDCGYDVLLSAYSFESIRRIVAFSLDVLEAQGFGRAQSFRAGGWLATPRVIEAIAAEGLSRDASAVDTELIENALPPYLVQTLRERWPDVGPTSQPYTIDTHAGPVLEVPSNGGLVDYFEAGALLSVYQACAAEKRAHPTRRVVFSTGFHHDSAAARLPVLTATLEAIEARRRADGIALHATTLRDLDDDGRRTR